MKRQKRVAVINDVNGVSNPAKCPQDIPSEDLLID